MRANPGNPGGSDLGGINGHSLLAVFAHPDDESLACGGLLAQCAQLGAKVSLLCATHGKGRGAGDIRATELQAAARVLGIANVMLLDYEDGMLPWADSQKLEADIRDTLRRVRPDVVITFGEDGLYWHPDHIAIHERTTAAVAALGVAAPALYYVTMPPGQMRAVMERAAATVAEQDSRAQLPGSILGIADPDAFGALAASPTLVVDVGEFASRKLAAIKCHRTQLIDDAFSVLSDGDAPRLLGTEHFRRAELGTRADAFIERLAQGSQDTSTGHRGAEAPRRIGSVLRCRRAPSR